MLAFLLATTWASAGRAPPAPAPAAPHRPPVWPMEVGDRWEWSVNLKAQQLLILFAQARSTSRQVGTWTLEVTGRTPAGHALARWTRGGGGQERTTELELWSEADGALWMRGRRGPEPALGLTVPPGALAAERVPCEVHFLGEISGTCSPAPSGRVPPGLDHSSSRPYRPLGLVVTAMVAMPTVQHLVVELEQWVPARPPPEESAVVQRWRGKLERADLPQLTSARPTAEELGLVLSGARSGVALYEELQPRLPPEHRLPLLRVVLARTPEHEQLRAVARASRGLPIPAGAEEVRSVQALLPEADAVAVEAVLAGRWGAYVACAGLDRYAHEAFVAALRAHPPDLAEAGSLLKLFPLQADEAYSALVAGRPSEEQVSLLTLACDSTFGDCVDRIAATPDLRSVWEDDALGTALFAAADDERADALNAVIDRAPPSVVAHLLVLAVESTHQRAHQTALLRKHPRAVRQLSPEEEDRIVAAYYPHRQARLLLRSIRAR